MSDDTTNSAPAGETKASSANDTQVGGTHYKTPLEHWDFVERNRLSYVIGCATKYVTRHKKKAGPEDLAKAGHYTDKALELHASGVLKPLPFGLKVPVSEFAAANDLGPVETMAVELLAGFRTKKDLVMARKAIQTLIDRPAA